MTLQFRLAVVVLALLSVPLLKSQTQKETTVTQHATGPFEVKLAPLDPAFKTEDNSLGRMSIDKQFHGDLEATSKGEMLTGMTQTKGSAGYVAIEKVTGTLDGRTGTFILQHNATMDRGTPSLNIIVVPDSGTAQLTGLTGTMNIIIAADKKHSYDLTYTLPPQ
ncbi:MAG TPA: DUF3224 domain-containing protein [Candidatus Acidoferrum sp.]|nr:DUF3224 domain-containing protein [Candidatus Acidoferrum sp.]